MITSASNAHLKLVRKLAQRRGRQQEGAFVAEGEDLVLAGIECGRTPRFLLVDADRVPDIDAAAAGCEVLPVDPKLFAGVSELGHPPRVIGVFEVPEPASSIASGAVVLLDGVGDPGNVGTVLRSAAAFGCAGVTLGDGTADPYSGKAVRASMGAIFRVPIVDAGAASAARSIVVLEAAGSITLRAAAAEFGRGDVMIVVGGERDGVSESWSVRANVRASIPQDPAVESVNAGVAASIALYEFAQARQDAGS